MVSTSYSSCPRFRFILELFESRGVLDLEFGFAFNGKFVEKDSQCIECIQKMSYVVKFFFTYFNMKIPFTAIFLGSFDIRWAVAFSENNLAISTAISTARATTQSLSHCTRTWHFTVLHNAISFPTNQSRDILKHI